MNRLFSNVVTGLTIVGACSSGLLLMAAAQRPGAQPRDPDAPPAELQVACSASGPTLAAEADGPADASLAGIEAPAALALAR